MDLCSYGERLVMMILFGESLDLISSHSLLNRQRLMMLRSTRVGVPRVLWACISQLPTSHRCCGQQQLSSLPHPEPPATALFHTRPQAAALGRSCCSRPHSASLCRSLPHSSAHYRNLPLPLCLPLRALFFAEASRALSAAPFSQSATHRSRVSCVVRCESRQYGGARLMAACGVQWPARSMGSIV